MKSIQSLNIPQTEEENECGSAEVLAHTNTFMSQELIKSVT